MKDAEHSPETKAACGLDIARLKSLARELDREDMALGLPLLDAAVAGLVLGFRPSDQEMRRQAARCWQEIKLHLAQHLRSEDEVLLSRIEGTAVLDWQAIDRVKQSHRELNALARDLERVSFEEDPDDTVAPAGKALVMLAMKLDDMIDSEELYMLPALRKALFATDVTAPGA